MKLQDWIKVLYEYGPFAILVFLVFVPERKIRAAIKQASDSEKRTLWWAYLANWAAVFGLAVFSVYAWSSINLSEQPTIRGTIEGVLNSEVVNTSFQDLYLHAIPHNEKYLDYQWILVPKERRFEAGEIIEFTIGGKDHPEFVYELPIDAEFYKRLVRLKRVNEDLFLSGSSQPLHKSVRLTRLSEPASSEAPPGGGWESWFIASAHAQAQSQMQQTSIEDFGIGLESPDPLVRRKTRADLAKQNPIAAVPWIEDKLEDSKSSYRLKLGVLVALNQMPGARADLLRPKTITVVQTILCDSDDTLRNEAYSYLQKSNLMPVVLYEDVNEAGRSQGFGPCTYLANRGQFWKLPNDSASSVQVAKGYTVRLCESEGSLGTGAGKCETYHEGSVNLTSLSDQVSFVDVKIEKNPVVQARAVRRKRKGD